MSWYYQSVEEYEKLIYEWKKRKLDIEWEMGKIIRDLCEYCNDFSLITTLRNLIQAYDEKDDIVKKTNKSREKSDKVIEKTLNEIINRYALSDLTYPPETMKDIGMDLYINNLEVEIPKFLELYKNRKLIYNYNYHIIPCDDKVRINVKIIYDNIYIDGSVHEFNFKVK